LPTTLTEIPSNGLGAILIGQLFLQKSKNFSSVCPIDISLLKKDKLFGHVLIELLDKLQNFLRSAGLLCSKLIAWKGQNLESTSRVLIVYFGQLGIVFLGQTSFGGYIDDHDDVAFVGGHGCFVSGLGHDESVDEFVEGGFGSANIFSKHDTVDAVLEAFEKKAHDVCAAMFLVIVVIVIRNMKECVSCWQVFSIDSFFIVVLG
jgi:hypothetical protein